MKMLIDVTPLEYEKMVICIKRYNDLYATTPETQADNSMIVDYAVSRLTNEYLKNVPFGEEF